MVQIAAICLNCGFVRTDYFCAAGGNAKDKIFGPRRFINLPEQSDNVILL
jgi:hypothetical protein